jgi:surfactin synthase thioesterase subunit
MADRTASRWFACRERNPEAPVRLYCFPHSGGTAGEYVRWADHLPDVEVWGLQLPGRGGRHGEAPLTWMPDLVEALVEEAAFDGRFALFGHSLGALVSYEVARRLRATGRRSPEWLFVSAYAAPHLPRGGPMDHLLSDAELADRIDRTYGTLPAEVRVDPELLALVLPAYRSDLTMVETYEHVPGEPLDCPLTVFGGTDDEATEAQLTAWRRHTTGPFAVRWLPGGHFYLREQRDALLGIIADSLRRDSGRPAS